MTILVINTGSSSIKYKLFGNDAEQVLAYGNLEKIGESVGQHTYVARRAEEEKHVFNACVENHTQGLKEIVSLLSDKEKGVIPDKSDVIAIGHRVVHGAETFRAPCVITDDVLKAIEDNVPLAPIHNPANIKGISVAREIFPEATQVAIFDTAFHHSIPAKAHLYALPYSLYEKCKIRKYGFHGTSHFYISGQAAKALGKPLAETNLITIHLGNGGSITAVQNGKSVDTSMGMTPLEGLIMGTRSGDIDPAIPHFLAKNEGMSVDEINDILNKESGLKGICGMNDMRDIEAAVEKGDEKARTALEMYVYRIKKYIGAYCAVLDSVDAIVFTAGIGEHSPLVRGMVCEKLQNLGIIINAPKNEESASGLREIHSDDSTVKIFVIPTDEELQIAIETKAFLDAQ